MGNENFAEACSSQSDQQQAEHLQSPAIKKAKIVVQIESETENICPRHLGDSGSQRLVEEIPRRSEESSTISVTTNNNDNNSVAETSIGVGRGLNRVRRISPVDPQFVEPSSPQNDNEDDDDVDDDGDDYNYNRYDEEEEKWHARQVARSHIDNHINHCMESYNGPPGNFLFGVNTEVQDQGIMMAIDAHGLQPVNAGGQQMPRRVFISQPSPLAFISDPITRFFELPRRLVRETLQDYEDQRTRWENSRPRIDEPNEEGLETAEEPESQPELHSSKSFLNEAIRVAIIRKGLSINEGYEMEQ